MKGDRAYVSAQPCAPEALRLSGFVPILLREHMDQLPRPPKVQVFATDVDETAIAIARLGRYASTLLRGLSQERLNRFFYPSGYQIAKEIRELGTFSVHSVVRDPPFVRDPPVSRMDLISCRNPLIYLDQEQQVAINPAFH
jgi:two-component system CheB/CheR fusion protein